jgi:energy-coupling factor transporter ATP-binding protein EcfA2
MGLSAASIGGCAMSALNMNSGTSSGRDFDRLCDAVAAGYRLPEVSDLIRGCPFMKNDIGSDAGCFADRELDRLDPGNAEFDALMFALFELTAGPAASDFVIAAAEFERAGERRPEDFAAYNTAAARCYFYSAVAGDADAVQKVAGYAVTAFYSTALKPADVSSQCRGTVAWLLAATQKLAVPSEWTRETALRFVASADEVSGPGRQLLERIQEARARLPFGDETAVDSDAGETHPDDPSKSGHSEPSPRTVAAATPEAEPEEDDVEGVVVMSHVGNCESAEGRRIAAEFRAIIGKPLPLGRLPDLRRVRAQMLDEFPHASSAIDTMLAALPGPASAPLPPIILVGPAGSGKSRFAARLGGLLALPSETYPCAGVPDGSLAGTPRRWSTAHPALPVSLIRRVEHPGPVVILDEIDKAATARTNGSLWDALLAMLEPSTARTWRDPYTESEVDLSYVSWIATANDLELLPRTLVDRCLVVPFQQPEKQHLASLANRILCNMMVDRRLDPRWATPLDGVEIAALSAAWTGGSIRHLTRLVRAVEHSRSRFDVRH